MQIPTIRLHRWLCWLLITMLAVTYAVGTPRPVAAQDGALPRFEDVPCTELLGEQLAFTVDQSGPVTCGYVLVPAEYDTPGSRTLRLGVVRFLATTANPATTPLVLAQGGPGGSTIDTYLQILPQSSLFAERDRDIILFDQRGTYYAEPFLRCDELFDLTIETLDQDLADDEAFEMSQAALGECRDRLTMEVGSLSAFDSIENATDVESLRVALGYNQINFYGVSYGSLLAL
ncbi:MAG: alpha/beta fold hydrolase, partial [Chloroflexaceae bacterium]|nr:alpha/beta fold hydrolase [Chloroflexaceae bacterium]